MIAMTGAAQGALESINFPTFPLVKSKYDNTRVLQNIVNIIRELVLRVQLSVICATRVVGTDVISCAVLKLGDTVSSR